MVLAARIKEITDDKKIQSIDESYLEKAIGLLKERVSKIDEIIFMGSFFFHDPDDYDEKALKKWKDDSKNLIRIYREGLDSVSEKEFKADKLKSLLEEIIQQEEVGFGKLMMPLRIAVTGQGFGPDLFTSMELLGRETVIRRIDRAIEKLP